MKLPRCPQSMLRNSWSSHGSEDSRVPAAGVLTISLPPSVLGDCLVHLDALAALRHRPPALHRPNIVGRLSLLFGQLGQAAAQARGEPPGGPRSAHPAVVQAMRLLEADLARNWTLTGLAAELHFAPGYLVRLFNAATGLPPMVYLGQLRAEHAAVLLLHSDEPVTSIGRAVGWPDQSGFARRFKARYGLSATTYRKRFATRAAPSASPRRGRLLTTRLSISGGLWRRMAFSSRMRNWNSPARTWGAAKVNARAKCRG